MIMAKGTFELSERVEHVTLPVCLFWATVVLSFLGATRELYATSTIRKGPFGLFISRKDDDVDLIT